MEHRRARTAEHPYTTATTTGSHPAANSRDPSLAVTRPALLGCTVQYRII
ncbi:MAG: hypothetical protein ACXVRK_01830 [Gaiellaceae bacterium]